VNPLFQVVSDGTTTNYKEFISAGGVVSCPQVRADYPSIRSISF